MTTPFPFVAASVLTAAELNAITTLPIATKTANYVAVVGDVGKRIVMNMAGANTITINNSIFAEGDTIFLANKGAGSTTITAGAGVTINTSGSLVLAQYGGGTLVALSASVFTFFSGAGSSYGTATGGIGAPTAVTINSINYQYLTFNSTGTLTVTKAGFFDYLAIGGGTGNNNESGYPGGGGGSGALVIGSFYLSANATVTIGAGSATVTSIATQRTAGDTTINAPSPFAVLAVGSQSIGNATRSDITGFVAGGAGFGAGGTTQIGLSSVVSGYRGGKTDGNGAGGGGGGFSAVGNNGVSNTGGAGGAGFDVSVFIGGSSLFKASGAGGGGATTGGLGGSSLGNNGSANTTPVSGAANTGCGGAGGLGLTSTGQGGSGICYIRFQV